MKSDSAELHGGVHYLRSLWDISAFALAIQFSLTVFYLISSASTIYRIPDAVLLVQLSIGLLILLLPDLLFYRWTLAAERGTPPSVAVWTAIAASILVALGFLFSQVESQGLVAYLPAIILALCGLPIALFHFSIYLRQTNRSRSLTVVLLGIVFGAYLGFVFWGTGYHSPFFAERILSGLANIDTLYHSAVANLLQTYLFPTIGLDGAIPITGHWGSHFVLGSLAGLHRISIVDVYSVSYPIIFLPLFFKALLLAGLELARAGFGAWSSPWSTALVTILFASLHWPWFYHPFVAASTTLGLTAGFLLLATAARSARAPWFYFAAFCLGWAAVFFKISVGVPVFLCLAYLFVRCREYRAPGKLLQFAAFGLTAAFLTWSLVLFSRPSQGAETEVSAFDVIENVFEYSPPVFILYLSWIILSVLLLGQRRRGRSAQASSPPQADLRLWWELLSVLALSTLAFAAFVWRVPSDAAYFLITYFFLSVPILLVMAQWILERARIPAKSAALLSIFAVLSLLARADVLRDYEEVNLFRSRPAAVEEAQRRSGRVQLLDALRALGRLSKAEKRASAIFVPRTNELYWELRESWPAAHFLVQSLTGIAMIGGQQEEVFSEERHPYPGYDLPPYRRETYVDTVEDAAAEAGRLGYESLLIVDYQQGSVTVSRRAP